MSPEDYVVIVNHWDDSDALECNRCYAELGSANGKTLAELSAMAEGHGEERHK